MSYKSPLYILESLDISPDDLSAEALVRVRKKILADFNLNNTVEISIGNKKYTKDEVLKAIDSLKEIKDIDSHKLIFKSKKILNWLENPTKTTYPWYEVQQLSTAFEKQSKELAKSHFEKSVLDTENQPDYVEFESNEAYQDRLNGKAPLDNILGRASATYILFYFKKRNFEYIKLALANMYNLNFEGEDDFLNDIYSELDNLIEEFVADKEESDDLDSLKYRFLTDPDFTDFLNNLPNGFDEIRDRYVAEVVNYIAKIQHHSRQKAHDINYMLCQTTCDADLEKLVNSNQGILEGNVKSENSSGEMSGVDIAKWIFGVIFILAKVAACSN
jgi:hypothetical protein